MNVLLIQYIYFRSNRIRPRAGYVKRLLLRRVAHHICDSDSIPHCSRFKALSGKFRRERGPFSKKNAEFSLGRGHSAGDCDWWTECSMLSSRRRGPYGDVNESINVKVFSVISEWGIELGAHGFLAQGPLREG
jgi:hypothetical protein